MRLYELLEADVPGLANVLNMPKMRASSAPASTAASTANAASNTNTMTSPQNAQTNGQPQQLSPQVKQTLVPGGSVKVPLGQLKTPTMMKVKTIGNDPQKSVTLVNPQKPMQPGQVYSYANLATAMTSTESNPAA